MTAKQPNEPLRDELADLRSTLAQIVAHVQATTERLDTLEQKMDARTSHEGEAEPQDAAYHICILGFSVFTGDFDYPLRRLVKNDSSIRIIDDFDRL